MLKPLIIVTVLLPTLAIAQRSQHLPQPRQPGQWCPVGWTASGNYCVPGSDKAMVPGRLARERQLLRPLRGRSCEHLIAPDCSGPINSLRARYVAAAAG